MKGNEFIKRVFKLARDLEVKSWTDAKRGKGSHITLYFGSKKTTVRNPKDELKKGTLHAMIKQLGLKPEDIL